MRDRSLSPDSRFYSAMAALMVVAIVAGFGPTYDLWSGRGPHSVSLRGATAPVAIDITTTWWLAQVGS